MATLEKSPRKIVVDEAVEFIKETAKENDKPVGEVAKLAYRLGHRSGRIAMKQAGLIVKTRVLIGQNTEGQKKTSR